jgi:hypothetical protein
MVELEVSGLVKATVTDLIGCLNDWTVLNLKVLNVSNSTFVDQNKYTIVMALSKLHNLTSLNVSGSEFNKTSLEMVIEDLPFLDTLDISNTKVTEITALKKAKNRLKYLAMYGLKLPGNNTASELTINVLIELDQLRHLDVSDDNDPHPFEEIAGRIRVSDFLVHNTALPHLNSLDISGKKIQYFLKKWPDRSWKDLFLKSDFRSDQDHLLKKDQDHIKKKNLDFRSRSKIIFCPQSPLFEGQNFKKDKTIYV